MVAPEERICLPKNMCKHFQHWAGVYHITNVLYRNNDVGRERAVSPPESEGR